MAEGRWCCVLATLLLASAVMGENRWGAEGKTVPPALFIFGDSIVDVGNNNFLNFTTAKANFPPYGVDFPGGKATGRFSNGYNTADFLAQEYGFDESPPAFLSLLPSKLASTSICKGVNFASGGSGIFDGTGISLGGAIPLDAQIEHFKVVLKSLSVGHCAAAMETGDFVSKSIFLFSTGSNDLFGLYRSNATAITSEFITGVASKFAAQLQVLYALGARRFGVLGLTWIGCCPTFRSQDPTGKCSPVLDADAIQFNDAVSKLLAKTLAANPGVKYSVGDGIGIGKLISANPLKYGFKEYKSACCGGGKLNAQAACTLNATLCSDRHNHFFWDMFHPTAAAAKTEIHMLFNNAPRLANPITFADLAN